MLRYTEVNLDPLRRRFEQVEVLAHDLAYTINSDAHKPTLTQSLVDEDGITREYAVSPVIGTHAGLVCNILHGLEHDNPRVHVLFRGTHNLASAARNLETYGVEPGANSYAGDKALIMAVLKAVVEQKQENCAMPIELSVAGHSLGAGDTQRCVANVLEEIATPNDNCLTKIGALNIMIVNPVGVASETSKRCKNALYTAKNKHPALQVNYFPIFAEGDGIQQTGYTRIFASADPEYVNTNLLKFDHGLPKQLFKQAVETNNHLDLVKSMLVLFFSHTAAGLKPSTPAKPDYKIYSNQNAAEAISIKNELKNTVYKKLNRALNPHKIAKNKLTHI